MIGRAGVLSTAQGLKLGSVGGKWDQAAFEAGTPDVSYQKRSSKEADDQDGFTPIIHPSSITSIIDHPICSSSSTPESELEAARQPALPTPFQGLELLLLNNPPPNLSLLSKSFTSTAIQLAEPAKPLKEVVERSRPRYLFWAEGDGYWEREPISWQEEGKEVRWTRAVKLGALGAEGDGKKARVS
jgi:hypothetical protein